MSVSDPGEKIEWGADSESRKNERVPSSAHSTVRKDTSYNNIGTPGWEGKPATAKTPSTAGMTARSETPATVRTSGTKRTPATEEML
jgi:hypothetical protein